MARKSPSDENVFGGSWSVKKLECVEAYLESYLKVFKSLNWADLWYIEAFSGDGMQGIEDKSCDEITFFEGSSLRAISLASENDQLGERTFDHFVFIEVDSIKIGTLRNRIAETYPDQLRKCHFIEDDVNKALPALLRSIDWQTGRAVSFIDPCATQLKWSTLKAFEGTCSDVWLLFPLSAIIRLLPRENLPNDGNARRLDTIFGNSDWRNIYYDPAEIQPRLFDDGDQLFERHSGTQELLQYATKRFEEIFPTVLEPGMLRNEKNSVLFALYALISNKSNAAQKVAKGIASHLIRALEG